jgi:short-subunit dehydrogenase
MLTTFILIHLTYTLNNFQKVRQHFDSPPPSILINAAGINRDGLAVRFVETSLEAIIATNVIGTMHATKVFLQGVLKDSSSSSSSISHIITLGSSVGLLGNRGQSVYSTSKSALLGWTLSLAKEYADRGIRVHLVCPSLVKDTEMAKETLNQTQLSNNNDLRYSLVTKEDVIRAIDYLIQSPSSNGIILPVGSLVS